MVGATNRPQELDEAARRRLVKRLYVPLPDAAARRQIVENLLRSQRHQLGPEQLEAVAADTDGYSGADVANLCREAALGPIRCIGPDQIHDITPEQVSRQRGRVQGVSQGGEDMRVSLDTGTSGLSGREEQNSRRYHIKVCVAKIFFSSTEYNALGEIKARAVAYNR